MQATGKDDDTVTLDAFPHLRLVAWGSLIRTVARYVGIALGAGVAMVGLGYVVYQDRADLTSFFLMGLLMGSPSLYIAGRWTLHFSFQLRQLAKLEAKIRAGESIPISQVRFHVYGLRKPKQGVLAGSRQDE